MRPSAFVFLVVCVAVAVPIVVIALGEGLARYVKWAEPRPARRRLVVLATAGVYVAIGLLGLISREHILIAWIFLLVGAGSVLAAWFEARRPGLSEPEKP